MSRFANSAPLDDLVTIYGGGTPSRSNPDYYDGEIPWVTPKDMKSWKISGAQIRITKKGLNESATRLVPASSVLLVVRSGILKHSLPVAITNRPVALNQDMKALVCNGKLLPEYLARFLQASAPTILKWVRATTADNFSVDKLKSLPVPLPPLDEQRRIAAILDAADSLRAKRRAALAKLDQLAQSIFIEMFGDAGRSGWPVVEVSELAAPISGAIRTGPFGSQLLHSEFVDKGIAVLGIDNVVSNEFQWAQRRFITGRKYADLRRYTVRPGDVLITIMGTCGRCAVVPDDIPTAINTKHLCCITLDHEKCLPEFLHSYFLQHPLARRYLDQTAKGAIMAGLNMGIIKEMPVAVPPIGLQRDFVSRIASLRSLRDQYRAADRNQEALFASLQHRAFRGEL
jgi:type I restriction enzyme, S subunit